MTFYFMSTEQVKLTWVFPSFVPLDEADDEEDQDEQRDGTHQADEPSLSGDVHLSARHGWRRGRGRLCVYTEERQRSDKCPPSEWFSSLRAAVRSYNPHDGRSRLRDSC